MQKTRFDRIILDVMMADNSGAQFLKELRNKRNYIPVGLHTYLSEQDAITKPMLRKSNVFYLSKPLQMQQLKKFLEQKFTLGPLCKENDPRSPLVFEFAETMYGKHKDEWKKLAVLKPLTLSQLKERKALKIWHDKKFTEQFKSAFSRDKLQKLRHPIQTEKDLITVLRTLGKLAGHKLHRNILKTEAEYELIIGGNR
jgi:response regulator RpfG family c-di-GMP phosphodiesterase